MTEGATHRGDGEGRAQGRAPQAKWTPEQRAEFSRKICAKAKARKDLLDSRLDGPPVRTFSTEVIKNVPTALRGRSGIPRNKNGIPEQEQNPDLYPLRARGFGDDPGVFDDMLRTDGTCAGLSGFIKRAGSTAEADVWIPPNPTMAEGQAAELTARFFGIDGRQAWLRGGLPRHIRQSLRSIDYGCQPFEKIWEPWAWKGGVVMAPSGIYQRATRSVKGWVWDGDRFAGMVQETTEQPSADATVMGLTWEALGFRKRNKIVIPADQLLLYTFDPSGEVEGNPEGVSIFRPGYIWWRTKRDLIVRYNMAADRLFGGVTWLQQMTDKDGMPLGSEGDLDSFGELYEQWAEGLLGWLAAPDGWKAETAYPGFDITDPVNQLKYCDTQMQAVFAAQLLGGGVGAGEINQQMLYNSIDSIMAWQAEVLNGQPGIETTGLVRDLIDYNIPHDEDFRYPRIYFKGVEYKNTKSYVDAITKVLQYFGMTYTVETERQIRQMLDMPALTPEQEEARRAFEARRLTVGGAAGEISQGGTQAPVVAPQEEPTHDPDGEDDADAA